MILSHKLFYISITLQQLHSNIKYMVTDNEFHLFFFFKARLWTNTRTGGSETIGLTTCTWNALLLSLGL